MSKDFRIRTALFNDKERDNRRDYEAFMSKVRQLYRKQELVTIRKIKFFTQPVKGGIQLKYKHGRVVNQYRQPRPRDCVSVRYYAGEEITV